MPKSKVMLDLGGTYTLTDRMYLFGKASYATGLSNAADTSALSANAGLKIGSDAGKRKNAHEIVLF